MPAWRALEGSKAYPVLAELGLGDGLQLGSRVNEWMEA